MNRLTKKFAQLRECISYVVMENKWKDRSKYGGWPESAVMHKPVDISALENLYMEPYTRIQPGLRLISFTGKFIVKKYAACGANLLVVTGNHTPTVGVPQFSLGQSHINDSEKDIVVEEGAWVGANTTLLSGAHIGRCAVIGACSMVNRDIPPYAVAVGCPAKVIATTFTLEQAIKNEELLFKPEDRLSESYLRELFAEKFAGLRAIGTDEIKDVDKESYEKIRGMVEKVKSL